MATPPPVDDDLYCGQRFGNYLIHECVGRGGMARVYRAEHLGLEKVVALKVMERERIHDLKWRARFVREAKSAAVVKHPHIVDVTDVGVEGEIPYLVMEYLVGGDLAAHLSEVGALSEETMADLLLPIIAGLAFAHDAGVIHRDIKPSNIFLARALDGSVVPKLLDFGIAKSSFALEERGLGTDTDQVIGTPMFMAPEALDGARFLTGRSDQYSLGLVMYQCLTGRPPFEVQTPSSLLRAVATARLRPLRSLRPGVSRAVEKLVARTLELDPVQRFEHVRDVGDLLLSIASPRSRVLWESSFGAGAGAGAAPRAGGSRRGARATRKRAFVALGVVVLGVAVAAGIRTRRGPPPASGIASVSVPTLVLVSPAPPQIETEVVSIRPVSPSAPPAGAGPVTPSPSSSSGRVRERARAGAAGASSLHADTLAPSARESSELRQLFPGIGGTEPAAPAARPAPLGAPIPE